MSRNNFTTTAVCICVILLSIFPLYTLGNTTMGESTFPIEEEDEYIWESVNATESWYREVDFVRFTASKIYNETYNDKNYLFMNYTLEFYHRFSWVPRYTNSFYMAYNKTLNFLNWSEAGYHDGNLFLFPTPVNYTLIGEAVKTSGFFNYSVNGSKIALDYGNNTRIELTIDSSGISTIIERITNSTTIYRWELSTGIIVKVPFGNYFLTISIITIFLLIIVKKKKLKIPTDQKENIAT